MRVALRSKSLVVAAVARLLLGAGTVAACGSPALPPGGGGAGGEDTGAADGGGDVAGTADGVAGAADGETVGAADGAGVFDIGGPVTVSEDFWVVYQRHQRVTDAGQTPYSDLILTSWKNGKFDVPPGAALNAAISKFGKGVNPLDESQAGFEFSASSFKAAGASCEFGCLISPDMKYVAVATGPASATGYEYQIGSLNKSLQVFFKFGKIKDVVDIHFAGGDLFYSTRTGCLNGNTVCQYAIHKRFLVTASPSGEADIVLIPKMAPDGDGDITKDTTYGGHFQVSEDGQTLVMLTTTIRSVKVYAWRGGNLSKLDYICEHPVTGTNTECVGTGSQYRDTDKVAISPDGKTVVLFTIVDRFMRAHRYTIGSEGPVSFSNLVEVPSGNYLQQACKTIQSHPWQHVEVRGTPYFSADGKTIFHLGYSHCSDLPTDKDFTDIMALPLDRIGGPVGPNDWVSVTHNPRDKSTKNRKIFSFSMTPGRQVFLISATATTDQNGDPLPDTSSRQLKDSELYTLTLGEVTWKPLTSELNYDALLPQAVQTVAQ